MPSADRQELDKLVLAEQDRQNDCILELTKGQTQLRIDVAVLKVKAGVWGFLAGLLPSLTFLIYWYIKHAK